MKVAQITVVFTAEVPNDVDVPTLALRLSLSNVKLINATAPTKVLDAKFRTYETVDAQTFDDDDDGPEDNDEPNFEYHPGVDGPRGY